MKKVVWPRQQQYKVWREWAAKMVLALMEQEASQESQRYVVVTLRPNETTTVITSASIRSSTGAVLVPRTASAAAAAAAGIYQTPGLGLLTLTHAANAAADQTFGVYML